MMSIVPNLALVTLVGHSEVFKHATVALTPVRATDFVPDSSPRYVPQQPGKQQHSSGSGTVLLRTVFSVIGQRVDGAGTP